MPRTRCRSGLPVTVGLLIRLAIPLTAQTKEPARPNPNKLMTISGCVERSTTTPQQYTLTEGKGGAIYKLTGTNMKEYVGHRVQVVGQAPRRFSVALGLTPDANIAAQAGAMDPTRAAVASAGGSAGPGTVNLPEFRVKSVQPVSGACGS